MPETAVVIRVPEAEPAIGPYRLEHTPSGEEGLPAHVTLLVPFADSALLVAGMARELGEMLMQFSRFRFAITRLARFDGPPTVLYGVPEPAAPFVRLTERLSDRFGFPAYGGEHTTVIPHLTIATRLAAAQFDRIEEGVTSWLPIEGSADACEVWEHTDAGWQTMLRLPLRKND